MRGTSVCIPTFYIIGSAKCGTTFLQDALREHPEVFMPADETPFFEDPDYLESTSQTLSDIFSEARDKQLLGIKRPTYLHKMEVPGRIKKVAPHAKLIAILRNPITRAISAYFHNMRYGFVPPIDPNDGIRSIIDGSMQATYPRSDEVLDFGFYYRDLMHYLDFFDRD
jgi:Sulfotransferase domain